jgi:hypothetical protein
MFLTEKPCFAEGSAVEMVGFVVWLDTNMCWETKRAIAVIVARDTQVKGFIMNKINRVYGNT